jgi:hypothetical protein
MNILLVNTNVLEPPIFPVGLEYTAEFLQGLGHRVSILDMNVCADVGRAEGQHLVLVGVRNLDSGPGNTDFELEKTRRIVERIQVYGGDIGVAGAAVNILPEEIRSFLGVDYALASKGFGALRQLLDRLDKGIRSPGVIRDYASYV